MSVTTAIGTFGVALAAGIAAMVTVSTPGDQRTDPVTLTGCLRAGGHPSVFLLRGAAMPDAEAPSNDRSTAEDYLLVSVPGGVDLGALVNHRTAITGIVSTAKDGPPPPNEANAAERALKRLAVQSARDVAASCSGGDR
jgi:hypothetical protein